MKQFSSLTITFLLLILTFTKSHSQVALYTGIATEYTVSGTFIGGYGGLTFGKKSSVGVFYETRAERFDSRFNKNLNFYGAYFSHFFVHEEKLSLGALLRGGYERDRFVVVVPSILVAYRFSKLFSLTMISGARSEKPSIGLGLNFNFFK